ncbi:Lysine 5,6-aminomutase alpha subunit [Baekduia alba]|uniref:lysine 5,6-aminomutase subunit alpha n=1 Tax=Baekduia alba TaxID=2997333 RepID=UPI0023403278|nr:lysine 5,6-aminomutase subunit alpha [Baekduia alba]WCB96738.1 Lysine 5,6-aminomutase alpha subunit [Baekduia alba]
MTTDRAALGLDPTKAAACRAAAESIVDDVCRITERRTTFSIERAVARLLGVDGVDANDAPLPNVLVDSVARRGQLDRGIAYWIGCAMLHTGATPQAIAEATARGELHVCDFEVGDRREVDELMAARAGRAVAAIAAARGERRAFAATLADSPAPLAYVLTATGDVYEDVVHARAVAQHGGGIVAVIRSTAQSLLDYVPYGPTREGYGGTFATQANFRIMREAMDEWSVDHGRYIRLSSFCSGLCMPEIAVMGAIEGFDNMVNDALYGILYRDLNPVRTLIDQQFSRRVNGMFGITINTGEDNYLRTADAIEAAPSVVASQFINFALARRAGVPTEHIAVGSAFEVDPAVENGLLYEWAYAALTRELFPDCPIKYMPPTRHMNGDLFRTHATDTLFNLVTVATGQEIQTIGTPSEGIHTPHIHDRVLGLQNAEYVQRFARDVGTELVFRPGGMIQRHAAEALDSALAMLEKIRETSLLQALEDATFGDVSRARTGGRGADGIVAVAPEYVNPFADAMVEATYA